MEEFVSREKRGCSTFWVTEMFVCMIWFLFTPLSVPGEREMLTDEERQKSDEGLRRRVNELFPQAVLLTMRVSIEPLMTGGCSIAHTLTPLPLSLPPLNCVLPPIASISLKLAHTHLLPCRSIGFWPEQKQTSLRGQLERTEASNFHVSSCWNTLSSHHCFPVF